MHKIIFTALSLALVLGGTSGVMAAGKKHSGATRLPTRLRPAGLSVILATTRAQTTRAGATSIHSAMGGTLGSRMSPPES